MITTRTPLRVTLGGGGSDLVDGEGICIAATIDRYVTITVADEWTGEYVLHYSESERAQERHQIKHRILRETFERHDVGPCQVSSLADVPGGTGLGNSGAFTVGLLKALHPEWSRPRLAREAVVLDIGQQDQWSAVYGGLNIYDFSAGTIQPLSTSLRFVLLDTGKKHDSAEILTGPGKHPALARGQVKRMAAALEANDAEAVGEELAEQWATKLNGAPTSAHLAIDRTIRYGRSRGYLGGKLVGAGGGGFILFVDPVNDGRHEYPWIDISLTSEGSSCA
jgi:D-glycero-alpha-D-manno-heptose-7-phosphate kinase